MKLLNITYNNPCYSNYHYEVDSEGYYTENSKYYSILNSNIIGITRVCCVHCAYLIPHKYLSSVIYVDGSNRYEYVVFSDMLRKQNIPQYIDNTHKYGYLTFCEEKEDFDIEYSYNKDLYSF